MAPLMWLLAIWETRVRSHQIGDGRGGSRKGEQDQQSPNKDHFASRDSMLCTSLDGLLVIALHCASPSYFALKLEQEGGSDHATFMPLLYNFKDQWNGNKHIHKHTHILLHLKTCRALSNEIQRTKGKGQQDVPHHSETFRTLSCQPPTHLTSAQWSSPHTHPHTHHIDL